MSKMKTVHSISINPSDGFVTLNENNNECEGIVRYRRIDNNTYEIYETYISDEWSKELDSLIKCAFEDIIENGFIPLPRCAEAKKWYDKVKDENKKKTDSIMDINPNNADGSKKISKINSDGYDLFIEYPVREACRILNEKGIKTIMSSANKEDALSKDVPEIENGTLNIGPNQNYPIGNGYAWIMIDYKSLTAENKNIINSLNNGEIAIELSEDAQKRFVNNCIVNKVNPLQSELVKLYRVVDYNHYEREKMMESHRKRFRLVEEKEKSQDYFDLKANLLQHWNSLSYNGIDYPAVVLRYPIDETTSVEEINEYFINIANQLQENKKIRIL